MKNLKVIPPVRVRTGKVRKPVNMLLLDVLTYIEAADLSQLQVIAAAVHARTDYQARQLWVVKKGRAAV